MRKLRRSVSLVSVLALGILAPLATGQPLPSDPRLLDGVLSNGLRYVIRQHPFPPERVNINLHVSSGSFNETDEQRGVAHFLEHLAFNGSERFAPGTLLPYFESLGLTFGRHQNAMTGFADTTYTIELPRSDTETIEKGMRFLSDVAFGLSLLPEEIEKEREVILEEKRTRLGPMDRVTRTILNNIAPGSLLGTRSPIGVEETIMGVDQADFRDYYTRWYTPSNMTLLVVGDADPEAMLAVVKQEFERGESRPRPADADVGVTATEGVRAIVAADEELRRTEISINRVGSARGAMVDEPGYRERLVEAIGSQAFNYRMREKVSERKVSFLSAGSSSNDVFNTLRWTNVTASGEPENWREVLTDLGRELNRARTHGFSSREIQRIKDSFIANAEDEVRAESTASGGALIGSYRTAVAAGEPIMNAAQVLGLDKRLLPTITDEEVNAVFREVYTFDDAVFIAQCPTGANQPTEDDIVDVGVAALVLEAEAEGDEAEIASLVDVAPTPGKIVASSVHEATGVVSGWLDNGVRFHYMFNDYKKDQVLVSIALAGGTLLETAENHGVSQSAAIALRRPATRTFSSKQINDYMSDKKVGVGGGVSDDMMNLQVSGPPDEIEIGLQLAHLLLTEPVVEGPQLENYKINAVQQIESGDLLPQGRFFRAFLETLYPETEIRSRMLTSEEIGEFTAEKAQAWLDRMIAESPIEVVVVGDIDEKRARELIAMWLGSLPARDRISPDTYRSARTLPTPEEPRVGRVELVTQTEQAYMMAGFRACDERDFAQGRALNLAARILSTRMFKTLREEEQLVYSIQTSLTPGTAYPGYGLFYAWSQTEPDKVDVLGDRIMDLFREFAENGPTEEEMEVARKKAVTDLETQRLEPGTWRGYMSVLTYRGRSLDEFAADPTAFASISGDEVRRVFAQWYSMPGHLRVSVVGRNPSVVEPESPASPAGPAVGPGGR